MINKFFVTKCIQKLYISQVLCSFDHFLSVCGRVQAWSRLCYQWLTVTSSQKCHPKSPFTPTLHTTASTASPHDILLQGRNSLEPSHFKLSHIYTYHTAPVQLDPSRDDTQAYNEHHMLDKLGKCIALNYQSHTITNSTVHFWILLVWIRWMAFPQPCRLRLMWAAWPHGMTCSQWPQLFTSPLARSLQFRFMQ